ncbi:MAG TPA: hypothetical protein VGC69_01755 [Bordetella sp.]
MVFHMFIFPPWEFIIQVPWLPIHSRNDACGVFVAGDKTFQNISAIHGSLLAGACEAEAVLVGLAARAGRK